MILVAALLLSFAEPPITVSVIQDAVVVSSSAPLTSAMADVVSARALENRIVERGLLLLNIPIAQTADPRLADRISAAIDEAVADRHMIPITLCGGAQLAPASPIRGKIKGVYQVVQLPSDFGEQRIQYSIQVIAFGKQFMVIALGSEPPADVKAQLERRFARRKPIVTGCANSRIPTDWSAEIRATILNKVEAAVSRLR